MTCAYCGMATSADLCGTCAIGVTSAYYESNSVIVEAYVKRGLEQLDAYRAHHADFETWLLNHPGGAA